MKRKMSQQLYFGFGIVMAFLMVATLILPALQPDQVTHQQDVPDTPVPTDVPIPTFPPPITDFSNISFEEDYLHPSGLFTVGVPTGWSPNAPINNPNQAQISLNNPDAVSLIEAYVLDPLIENPTLDDLDARFDEAFLRGSWSQYSTWTELTRQQQEDRLLIDFSLSRSGQQFLARHAAWTDGDWIYVARVVVPSNARDLMFFLLDNMIENIEKNPQFVGTPLGWTGYYDEEDQHIIRFPSAFTLTDGSDGVPTSFVRDDGTVLRVEAQDEANVSSEDDAAAYVEALRSGISVDTVEATERQGGSGFVVNYTYTNVDGDTQEGEAVLLNGEDGQLHVANVLLPAGESFVHEPAEEGAEPQVDEVVTALETFSLLTGLNLPQPEPVETPEPESAIEETAEATNEAESTPEAEATAEMTAEATDEG